MTTGGTFIRFYKGTSGAAAAHIHYISRPSAVREGTDGVLMRNLPDQVATKNYEELRTNVATYAWAREESEQARHRARGECRTHFRATISFERETETTKAKEMLNQWLAKNFPDARAAAFLHRDSQHQHWHVYLDSRLETGRKIDLKPAKYYRLDESWNAIYCRELGRDEREHLDKKEATREMKRAAFEAKKAHTALPERPQRADLKARSKAERATKTRVIMLDRERRNHGIDEIRTRTDQPSPTDRTAQPTREQLSISAADGKSNRSIQAASRAVRIAEETIRAAETHFRERDLERTEGRSR